MITESKARTGFRMPTAAKWGAPRRDGAAPPERVFRPVTPDEAER